MLVEIGMGRQAESMREAIEAELAAAMEQGEITDAALASSESQREMFWRLRETIPEAQRHIGASIKHDVSVTTSELPRFIIEASQLVRAISPQGRIVSTATWATATCTSTSAAPSTVTMNRFCDWRRTLTGQCTI